MSETSAVLSEMLDDEKKRLQDNLREAIEKLGGIVTIRTDSPIIDIVSDEVGYTYDEDGGHFTLMGADVTKLVQSIQIAINPGAFPLFNVMLGSRGISIRASDDEVAKKVKARQMRRPKE